MHQSQHLTRRLLLSSGASLLALSSASAASCGSTLALHTCNGVSYTGTSVAQPTTVTTADALPSSLRVSWTAPADGSSPTDYTIKYRVSGTTDWTNFVLYSGTRSQGELPSTWEIVNGLSPNTSYEFVVTSVIASGTPTPSAIATGTTLATLTASAATYSSTATQVLAAYNNRPAFGVAPSSVVTIGASGAASTVNGRSTSAYGIVPTASMPHGIGPVYPSLWIYGNRKTNAMIGANNSNFRFTYTGQKFDFALSTVSGDTNGPNFRVRYSEDNGVTWVWATAATQYAPLNSGAYYVLVDFGSAATRLVSIYVGYYCGIKGFNFDTNPSTATPPAAAPVSSIRCAMWNDSYVFGQGASDFTVDMCALTAEYLGSVDIVNFGYQSNPWGRRNLAADKAPMVMERLSNAFWSEITAAGTLDIIFINGTINDATADATRLYNNAVTVFNTIRKYQPTALIVFTLQMYPPGQQSSDAILNAYRNAFAAVLGSDPGSILLETVAGTPWMPANDTTHYPSSGDTAHPNSLGHAYYANKMAVGALTLINRVVAANGGVVADTLRATSDGNIRVTSNGDTRRTS